MCYYVPSNKVVNIHVCVRVCLVIKFTTGCKHEVTVQQVNTVALIPL